MITHDLTDDSLDRINRFIRRKILGDTIRLTVLDQYGVEVATKKAPTDGPSTIDFGWIGGRTLSRVVVENAADRKQVSVIHLNYLFVDGRFTVTLPDLKAVYRG